MKLMSAIIGSPDKRNSTPAATKAKALLRRNVLQAVGADRAHVFDAFCGDGAMYRSVWSEAASCTGCDLEFYPDSRLAFRADNVRVMRAIDLSKFNIFDFDAYGSPWEQIYIMATRRRLMPGELFGIVLTEGTTMKMKMGSMSVQLGILAGVRPLPGISRQPEEVINRALRRVGIMMGGQPVQRWQTVGKKGSAIHYIALVLKGDKLP